jgi:hypothetical protein
MPRGRRNRDASGQAHATQLLQTPKISAPRLITTASQIAALELTVITHLRVVCTTVGTLLSMARATRTVPRRAKHPAPCLVTHAH